MKKLLTFILLLHFGFAFAQFAEENRDKELYKVNKVRSVKVYESRNRNGAPGRNEKLDEYKVIDTSGQIIESVSYDGSDYRQLFRYDSRGNITEQTTFLLKSPYIIPFSYAYDEKNRLAVIQKREHEQWIFSYDSANNIIVQKWISNTAYPESFLLDSFQYDSKNRMVKMSRYWNGNQFYFYKTFSYDDAGNKISETRFQNGEKTDMWIYYYDGNHHMTGWAHYGSDLEKTSESLFVNEYDQNGLLIYSVVGKDYRRYVYEFY